MKHCNEVRHSATQCNTVQRIATCRYAGGQGANEDDTEYTSYDIGEECLDRLAIALGGKTVLPIAFSGIPLGTASRTTRCPVCHVAGLSGPSLSEPSINGHVATQRHLGVAAVPYTIVQTSACRAFSRTLTGVTAMRAV